MNEVLIKVLKKLSSQYGKVIHLSNGKEEQ